MEGPTVVVFAIEAGLSLLCHSRTKYLVLVMTCNGHLQIQKNITVGVSNIEM